MEIMRHILSVILLPVKVAIAIVVWFVIGGSK